MTADICILGPDSTVSPLIHAAAGHGLEAHRFFCATGGGGLSDVKIVVWTAGPTDDAVQTLARTKRAAPNCILIAAGAGSDALIQPVLDVTGFPRERVIGLGTFPASVRFARAIAARLSVAPRDVHAILAGPAAAPVPMWSSASVAGVPLHQWAVMGHGKMSVRDRIEIFLSVAGPPEERKAAVDESEQACVLELIAAIVHDEKRILPVTTRVIEYDQAAPGGPIDGVCMSLPCIVGAAGAEGPIWLPMNDAERAGLRQAATSLRENRN